MPYEITGAKYNKLTTTYPFPVLDALEQLAQERTAKEGTLIVAADIVREAVEQYLHARGIDVDVEVNRGGFRGEPTPRKEFPPEKVEFNSPEAAAFLGLSLPSLRRYGKRIASYTKPGNKKKLMFARSELERFYAEHLSK